MLWLFGAREGVGVSISACFAAFAAFFSPAFSAAVFSFSSCSAAAFFFFLRAKFGAQAWGGRRRRRESALAETFGREGVEGH